MTPRTAAPARRAFRGRAARLVACLAAATALGAASPALAEGQEGYYYPPVGSTEVFDRKMIPGPRADAATREAFVTFITRAQLAAPETPPFALFAKGDGSRELILIGLDDQMFRTLYRARALLAQLTYNLRGTPFFRDQGIAATGTFFDMLQLLEFESLTVSDGAEWAHRITFE